MTFKITQVSEGKQLYTSTSPVSNCKTILPSRHSALMGSWDNEEVSSAAVSLCCLLCRAGSTTVILHWAMPMHPSLQWKHQHPQPRTVLMRCHLEMDAQGVCDQQSCRSLHLGPVQSRVYSLQLPTSWFTPIPGSQLLCSSVWQPFFLCGVKEGHREMPFATTHHMNGHLTASIPAFFNWLNWLKLHPTATKDTRSPCLLP